MFGSFRRQHFEDTQEVSSLTLRLRRNAEFREHCITGQVFERVEPAERVEVQSQEAKEEEQSGGGDGA